MIAVYPGSFDPSTNGHLDIIHRASKIVDKLIVAVLNNSEKHPLFTVEERMMHLKLITEDIKNVEVTNFSGLLVEFAASNNVDVIIRGLRAVTDFEYEFLMALNNRNLNEDVETLFISTNVNCLYLTSSVVKEIAKYGGNIDNMVPSVIKKHILEKFAMMGGN